MVLVRAPALPTTATAAERTFSKRNRLRLKVATDITHQIGPLPSVSSANINAAGGPLKGSVFWPRRSAGADWISSNEPAAGRRSGCSLNRRLFKIANATYIKDVHPSSYDQYHRLQPLSKFLSSVSSQVCHSRSLRSLPKDACSDMLYRRLAPDRANFQVMVEKLAASCRHAFHL